MRRIVLDTMVLASGFTSVAGASGELVQRWRDEQFRLIVSEHIVQELARTLGEDRYFQMRTTPQAIAAILALLRSDAIVTDLTVPVVGVATQPKDDLVLSTALSGEATILCTRDKQLLKLISYQSVEILSPGELVARLVAESDPIPEET